MPLIPGSSTQVINKNIAELIRSGYKKEQAVKIAFRKAGKQPKEK